MSEQTNNYDYKVEMEKRKKLIYDQRNTIMNEFREFERKNINLKSINSAEACKLMSCHPTTRFLEMILTLNNSIYLFYKSKELIIAIEKIIHRSGAPPANPITIITTAIYFSSEMSIESIGEMLGIENYSSYTIRTLVKKLNVINGLNSSNRMPFNKEKIRESIIKNSK